MDGSNSPDGGQVAIVQQPQAGTVEQLALSSSGGAPPVDSDDWRAQLPVDSRQWMVDTIMETLKKLPPFSGEEGLHGLKRIAVNYEEKIYSTATSQSDYLRKISLAMLTLGTKSQSPMDNSLQTGAADARRNSSDLASNCMQSQNMQNSILVAGVQNSGSSASTLPAVSNLTQGAVGQNSNLQNNSNVAKESVMKQTLQPGGMTQPMLQSHGQKQHQNLIQTGQIQSSQQAVRQPTMMQSASLSGLQQNHQSSSPMSQLNNMANLQQQLLISQMNNVPKMHQPQLGGGVSGLQQSMVLGKQSIASSGMPSNQHSVHMLQQNVPVQQKMQQSMSLLQNQAPQPQPQPSQQQMVSQSQPQSGQMPHLQLQSNSLQHDMQQWLPTSGSMLLQQIQAEQQKQFFQAMQEASSNSAAQTENSGAGDWQEEVYQKIKSMKDAYLIGLTEMHVKLAAKLQQHADHPEQPTNEQHGKLKFFKVMLERLVQFLRLSKNDIQMDHKDKLDTVEKQIINILNANKPVSLQQGQLPQPGIQNSQPQSQISQLQTQPLNPQTSVAATMGQNILSAVHQNTLSSVPSISNPLINTLQQPSSSFGLGQNSSLLSPQQVAVNSLEHNNTLSGPQSVNLAGPLITSQAGVNVLQPNLYSLHLVEQLQQQLKLQMQQQQQQQLLILQMQQQQQQQQQQQLTKLQPSAQLPGYTISPLHQITGSRDAKMSQQMGVKPGVFQQQNSVTLTKTGTPLLSAKNPIIIRSPSTHIAPSPMHGGVSEKVSASLSSHPDTGHIQASNAAGSSAMSLAPGHPSSQVNHQNLVTFLTRSKTPLPSANSPVIVPSPSTLVAPSPVHAKSEKVNANLSSHPNTVTGHLQAPPNATGTSVQTRAISINGESGKAPSSEPNTNSGHVQAPNAAGSSAQTLAISIGESGKVNASNSSHPNTTTVHLQAPNAAGSSVLPLSISIGGSEIVNASLSSQPNTHIIHLQAPNPAGSSAKPLAISIKITIA